MVQSPAYFPEMSINLFLQIDFSVLALFLVGFLSGLGMTAKDEINVPIALSAFRDKFGDENRSVILCAACCLMALVLPSSAFVKYLCFY